MPTAAPSGRQATSRVESNLIVTKATFLEDRVEILRRDGTITTRLDVIVSPEDDAEARPRHDFQHWEPGP